MTKVCYLTGVPGVGKTTVCSALQAQYPDSLRSVHFGELLANELRRQGTEVSEADMRRHARGLVTPDVIAAATTELVGTIISSSADWCVVDSHAASQEGDLFWATPDGRSFFEEVSYDLVIVMVAPPEVVLGRSQQQTSGRQARTITDLDLHQRLIEVVAVQYASLSECPVVMVPADGSLAKVVDQVAQLMLGASGG